MAKRNGNLRKFADRLSKRFGGNFFIDITYNPGRRSRSVHLPEVFIARPRLQKIHRGGAIENAHFAFKDWRHSRDEMGDAYGRGASADGAFYDLLRAIAGKPLILTLNRKDHPVHVPANIAD